MHLIVARNVNDALRLGLQLLQNEGHHRPSRAGDVLLADGPVTTLYERPTERVLFSPIRDANPFFHFMEGLWMIAGRNDVAWISQFNSTIEQFSDDGKTFHGAYGYRWRHHFGFEELVETTDGMVPKKDSFDQIHFIIELLKMNPNDRRIVLQMWDVHTDLGQQGKDFPCNTQILFRVALDGSLDMTVINRSNDMIWGAYGANAVHMSMLQEYVAGCIGIPVGRYWQMSNNFHAYTKVYDKTLPILAAEGDTCRYELDGVEGHPMINTDKKTWDEDLSIFMSDGPIIGFRDRFFRRVATPIYIAWKAWKAKDPQAALQALSNCSAMDWRFACEEWINRRMSK